MNLDTYQIPIGTPPTGNPITIYLQTDDTVTQVAANLADKPLQIENYGEIVAIYPDYEIISIQAQGNGIVAVTAERALEPDTKATLERLEFAHQETNVRLDEQDAALIELASIIGGA